MNRLGKPVTFIAILFRLLSVAIWESVAVGDRLFAPKGGLVHMIEAGEAIRNSQRLGLPSVSVAVCGWAVLAGWLVESARA